MNDLEQSVRTVLDAYRNAVYAQDVASFVQLYHPDVRVFDTWGVWSYEGIGAWRKMVEGWFSSLGAERVKVEVTDLKVTGNHDFCVASATVGYASVSPEGNELRSMQNRLTWALGRDGNAWKILHEHTSAPVGFEDGKAILARNAAG